MSVDCARVRAGAAVSVDRAVARVNLAAIERNCRRLGAELREGVQLCAVVKADGYGHGLLQSARAALAGGATWLAVASVAEARELVDDDGERPKRETRPAAGIPVSASRPPARARAPAPAGGRGGGLPGHGGRRVAGGPRRRRRRSSRRTWARPPACTSSSTPGWGASACATPSAPPAWWPPPRPTRTWSSPGS